MSEKITSEASLVKSGFVRGVGVHGGREKPCFSAVSQNQAQDVGFRQMEVVPPVQKMSPAVHK